MPSAGLDGGEVDAQGVVLLGFRAGRLLDYTAIADTTASRVNNRAGQYNQLHAQAPIGAAKQR